MTSMTCSQPKRRSGSDELLTYDEIFTRANDGDGYLVFEEFVHALKMIGVYGAQVSETEALQLFALGNEDGDGRLTCVGFRRTLEVTERKSSKQVLHAIGFDPAKLARNFSAALLCLLLLFFFIFMGIEGFTSGGSFGAVVNSVLPLAGGFMTAKVTSFGPLTEFMEYLSDLISGAVTDVMVTAASTEIGTEVILSAARTRSLSLKTAPATVNPRRRGAPP